MTEACPINDVMHQSIDTPLSALEEKLLTSLVKQKMWRLLRSCTI